MTSNETKFSVHVFCPRWGHESSFEFTLSQKEMRIEHQVKSAACSRLAGTGLEWSGHRGNSGNALEKILTDEEIKPAPTLVEALERAWLAWGEGQLDDGAIRREVRQLFDRLNQVSRSTPRSDA